MTGRTKALPPGVAQMMPLAGHIFEGKYRIVEPIGAGGFARVYRARFEDVARDVALKILVPQMNQAGQLYPEELVQRFHREARSVSDLRAPSTITLHDFGRTSAGLLYMIFEFVDGRPLDRVIESEAPIAPDRVVNVLRHVLKSLREAHAVGMLHRDVKPANIMLFDYLDQRDLVKILDFGIAKNWTHGADGQPLLDDLTEDGTVMGTPRYMSPEQIIGQGLTPATDIYSLGLVAYEMLAGVPAAPQTDKSGVVRQHLGPEPFVLPDVIQAPPGLRNIVERMVAKDVAARFSTADEVLAALATLRDGNVDAYAAPAIAPVQSRPTTQPGQAAPNQTPRYPHTGATPAHMAATIQTAASPPSAELTPRSMAQNTGDVNLTQPSVPRPQRTFIQVETSDSELRVDVPMKPSKRALIVAAATALIFIISWIAAPWYWLLPTMVVFGWGLSLVFRTHHLTVSPQTGYELTVNIFSYEQTKRGPMQSVVRLDARGSDEDENTVLKLVTHEGEYVVANAFTHQENQWVASQANNWLGNIRAQFPNRVG